MATKKALAENLNKTDLYNLGKKSGLDVKSKMKKTDLVDKVSKSTKVKKTDLEKKAKKSCKKC